MGRIVTKDTSATLGVLGKVKVGEMTTTQNGKSYPASIDYFRFTSNVAERVKRMEDMFGEKPVKLPITFHCDDTDFVCLQRYEIRDSGGRLAAYGNGKLFYESHKEGFVQKTEMTAQQGELYMQQLAANLSAEWKETLTLRFMVMGYPELGLWEFRTGGKETSIGQIIASFDTVMEQAGRVKGLPFWLTVHKHKSNRANANRQYPVVNLVCDLSPEHVERVLLLGANIKGLVTPQKLAISLPSGEKDVAPINDIETEYTEFEEVGAERKTDKPLLKKTDANFKKGIAYFFKNGAKTESVEQHYRLDEKAKEVFFNLEYWKGMMEGGDADESAIRANISEEYWPYFGIEQNTVPI